MAFHGAKPYVVSEDIEILLRPWLHQAGLVLPAKEFFADLRAEMKARLEAIFPFVQFVPGEVLVQGLEALIQASSGISTISLDRVYVSNRNSFLVDMSRLMNSEFQLIGEGSRTSESLSQQMSRIGASLNGNRTVQLVDDVIFSGGGIVRAVRSLQDHGIKVDRILVGVLIGEGRQALKEVFPEIEVQAVVSYDQGVVDEICERDFYPGVPLSGRLLGADGLPFSPEVGAPYVLPFGKPGEWASIPEEQAVKWSRFCLCHSAKLWREIEKISGRAVHCVDIGRLPIGVSRNGDSFAGRLEALAKDAV